MSYETMQYKIVKKHYLNRYDLCGMISEKNWFNSEDCDIDKVCNFFYNYCDTSLDEGLIKDMAIYILLNSDIEFIDKSVNEVILDIIAYIQNCIRVEQYRVDVDDLPI